MWPGLRLMGAGGKIPKGVFVAVAEVEPGGVRLDNGMRLKNQELLRATRPTPRRPVASGEPAGVAPSPILITVINESIPLTSGTSFIDPESIKIAFRVFANGQRCDDINYYGRTVAVHDLLKGREYNRNKAMEFDEVNDPRIARAAAPHHGGHPALREDAAAAAEPGDRN